MYTHTEGRREFTHKLWLRKQWIELCLACEDDLRSWRPGCQRRYSRESRSGKMTSLSNMVLCVGSFSVSIRFTGMGCILQFSICHFASTSRVLPRPCFPDLQILNFTSINSILMSKTLNIISCATYLCC